VKVREAMPAMAVAAKGRKRRRNFIGGRDTRGERLGKSKIRVVAAGVSGKSIRRGDGLRYSESLILGQTCGGAS
jgi:hypothetical protein